MNIIIQIIKPDTGQRTEPMSGDRSDLGRMLRAADTVPDDAIVLVLMEHSGDEWEFSAAPLFKKSTFCEMLEEKQHG